MADISPPLSSFPGTRTAPRRRLLGAPLLVLLASLLALGVLAVFEARTFALEAWLTSALAKRMTFRVEPGPSPRTIFPRSGPYDERLGYTRIDGFVERLRDRGFEIESQARPSKLLRRAVSLGLFPVYREKAQGGLRILDPTDAPLFAEVFPAPGFLDFESIPPLLVDSLLYVENRELLDPEHPRRNPAVEWDRFARAALNHLLGNLSPTHVGGSTLATQLEKFRHSPEGVTPTGIEKLRQITSASLRAYQGGSDTGAVRRAIVVDYMNSMPLAAVPGRGEILGLADGLDAWFGTDLVTASRILASRADPDDPALLAERGRVYKQALALILATQRPTAYLGYDRPALTERIERYLGPLADDGVISPALRDAARAAPLDLRPADAGEPAAPAWERKPTNAVRARLLALLGLSSFYELDRLDLSVETSLDRRAQIETTRRLRDLRERDQAVAAGLIGFRLLEQGDPAGVVYSFSLYERGPGVNWLRVQTDNSDQPLDVNEGAKLDLGSTAKLRTLVTYLEVVAGLHDELHGRSAAELAAVPVAPRDHLTRWAVETLAARPGIDLPGFLAAALERRYSASPWESFFTGGGLHSFKNFNKDDDTRILTVREAFRNSVNLVFIRLMRDVVQFYTARLPGAAVLEDTYDPERYQYLFRFADREGRAFLDRFYPKYGGKAPEEALDTLLEGIRLNPKRLATILRSVDPDGSFEAFAGRFRAHLPESRLAVKDLRRLYDSYSAQRFSLADRGYLASVHPLELWLLAYLRAHPHASRDEVMQDGVNERLAVYRWLFESRRKGAQDRRIRTLLEIEAFLEIHQQWRRCGYPFGSLVPSYATAIGSSADRPAALAELMGVIANDGLRLPTVRVERLRFAADTPFETTLVPSPDPPERAMRAEVAQVLRGALFEVVEAGTAVRARGAFQRAGGPALRVGGKTGTGDHRFKVFGPGGVLVDSRVVSRTATFVFLIEDRFYGVLTAHVAGPEAAAYGFTSSLPVQIFQGMAPTLLPLVEPPPPRVATAGS